MEIDIQKILEQVLTNHPSNAYRRAEFEQMLIEDFKKNLDLMRIEGFDNMKKQSKQYIETCKAEYKEILFPEYPSNETPEKDEADLTWLELWLRFNEAMIELINKQQRVETVAAASDEKPPKKDLPPFEDIVKEPKKLPNLWKRLAEMKKPLVSKSGQYIWDGDNVSVLMALAQSLITADRIDGKYSAEEVYRMLCEYFKQPQAQRPRIKAQTESGFTNVYSDYLTAFNDFLNSP